MIASVDPGLAHMGWCVGARYGARLDLAESGCIDTDPADDQETRLRQLWLGLARPFKAYRPKVVCIENQSPASIGKRVMQLKAAARGERVGGYKDSNDQVFEAVGIAKAVAWSFGARVMLFSQNTAKKAVTSNGLASKLEVINAIRFIYFPGMEKGRAPLEEHEADAIAGFICCERTMYLEAKSRRRRTR
jgi:Holliday junction resolvasome RuvABC endonuclease subunit